MADVEASPHEADRRDEIRNDPTISHGVKRAMEHFWAALDARREAERQAAASVIEPGR